jgi:uncharacterized membrane protein YkvA (DUF1232 family)
MALPKPKTKSNQIIVYLSGIFAAFLGLYYVLNKIDVVPDGLGPIGYFDDLIVLLLLAFFTTRFVHRVKDRFMKNKTAYQDLWRRGNLFKLFTQPRTWITILVLTGVFSYVFWALDVVPDVMVGVGYVDDAIAAIAALVSLIRLYGGKK